MKRKATKGEAPNPRVGVFLCHCGTNIAGVVDVPKVAEFARTIPGVAYVGENLHTCSSEGLKNIKEASNNLLYFFLCEFRAYPNDETGCLGHKGLPPI